MKSINQFDYPSKQAQSYKQPSQISMQDGKDSVQSNKVRYKQNLQYHMQLERNKAKQTQKNKKQEQSKRKKEKLQTQLQKKKKQLQNLEILKQQAQENQKKAYELAVLKQQQDRIKKQDDQKRKIQFDQNAALRFSEAMKKMYEEKQQLNFKERLAEQRRKTAQDFEKLQRNKAQKYRSFIEEREKNIQKNDNQGADEYRKTVKTFTSNPNPDYNKTCVHNLRVVSQTKKSQQNAFQRGRVQREDLQQKSEEKRRRRQQNQRRSKQRGRNALLKMQREKQYEDFQKQTTQEQMKYNLDRIQAGKKDQFIGVKPTTLSQMQISKKMRSQEEFDKMFYTRANHSAQNFNRPATKFQIVETRIPRQQEASIAQSSKVKKTKKRSFIKERQQSEIPCVSQGKYSFDQPQYSQFKNQSRSHSSIHEQNHQNEEQEQTNLYNQTNLKNSLKETRIPDEKRRESPQHSQSNKYEQKQTKDFRKQTNKMKEPMKQENQTFDTNEMLRKYGLKKESDLLKQKERNQVNKKDQKPQGKRKVVQLANICQNRNGEKQQLNYSSQSEQDSLS